MQFPSSCVCIAIYVCSLLNNEMWMSFVLFAIPKTIGKDPTTVALVSWNYSWICCIEEYTAVYFQLKIKYVSNINQ